MFLHELQQQKMGVVPCFGQVNMHGTNRVKTDANNCEQMKALIYERIFKWNVLNATFNNISFILW